MCSMCSKNPEALENQRFRTWNTAGAPLEHIADGTQNVFQNLQQQREERPYLH